MGNSFLLDAKLKINFNIKTKMDLVNRSKVGINCHCYPVTGHWRQLRWTAPMFPPKCLEKQGDAERGCLCLGATSQHIRSFSIVFLIVVFPSEWTSTPCSIYFILGPYVQGSVLNSVNKMVNK